MALSRRDMLRMGLVGSAASLAPRFARRAAAEGSSTTNTVGISAYTTQPWQDELKTTVDSSGNVTMVANMAVKQPVAVGDGCEDSLTCGTQAGPKIDHVPFEGECVERLQADGSYAETYHQRYTEFKPVKAYEIHIKEAKQKFHPAIPSTTVWGYDGTFPGPLFKARYGEPILVRFHNELPADHVGFGSPDVTTHLHNAHTPPESDGGPWNFFSPGTCWDNHYPNVYAGFTDPQYAETKGDPREALSTLWYHDHRQDFTAQNVYAGLAGMYLLYDELDCDDEKKGLRLPSGKYDVPLLFGDRVFGRDGNLVYDFFSLDGILGDKHTVNGKIQPWMKVDRRKYRFRLLVGGPSRVYAFGLSNGAPVTQIANDGNLLPLGVKRGYAKNPSLPQLDDYILLGVAERADIIVDFSKYAPGTVIYLNNYCEQVNGAGPTGKVGTPVPVLKFVVQGTAVTDSSLMPPDGTDPAALAAWSAAVGRTTLRELPDIDTTNAVRRSWDFGRTNGAWTVNGRIFDANVSSADVVRGSTEIWTLKGGGGWWHPVHIHYEEHQILSRTPSDGPSFTNKWEGRKDVALLHGAERVECFFRFRDWLGKYPMHCHNVVHEDHAMMVRFDLVDPNAAPTAPPQTT